MSLYTALLEYCGGTYILQVDAPTEDAAVQQWADHLRSQSIKGFRSNAKDKVTRYLSESKLVAVESCKNVWCASALVGTHLAILNLIKTSR
jgi:hypothetical protein